MEADADMAVAGPNQRKTDVANNWRGPERAVSLAYFDTSVLVKITFSKQDRAGRVRYCALIHFFPPLLRHWS